MDITVRMKLSSRHYASTGRDVWGFDVVMTPELERLLDEGLENSEKSQTTDELRHRI